MYAYFIIFKLAFIFNLVLSHTLLFVLCFTFFHMTRWSTLQVFIYSFWRMPEHLLSCVLLSIVVWNYLKSQWFKTRCIYFLTASVGQWQLSGSVSGLTPGCSHWKTRPRKFPVSLKSWLRDLRSVLAFWQDSALCHPCLCVTP